MMKMTLIARIADGLPLAEGLHDGHDLQDNEVYKEQGMSLIKKLPRGGNEASYITRGRVCCLTMCDHCYPEELAFKYLEDLKSEFERVDGLNIETATRPYEFGTFMHKNGKLYQKEASSLRDLCLKSLTGSLTYVNSMPEDLLKRFLGLCTSEELLRIDINNDIYKLTDPVWKRFYQHEFGSKETELVHQNLGMCDTSFKWSECFHEKLCSEGVYNKYPFAPMARKVRRRVKLLTNMYTPYEEVHEWPSSPKLRPASTSLQQDIKNEKKIDVYNITTSDGVEGEFFIENKRKMELIEFLIICPPSQDHSFIDEVVETAAATTITHMRSSICNGSSIINGLKSALITTTKLPPAPYLCYIKISPVFFSDLKSGRCSFVVEARLLRFWEARNVKRGGELMWMDLLMVDVNSTMMQVTISAGRLPQFREMLHAGTMFSVSGFDVSRCAQNFWLTDSSLMIQFNESTSFQELTKPVSPLPEEAYRFRNQSELIGLANTNTQLLENNTGFELDVDIIGEILSVKSTVCDPPEEKNRVMVTLKLDSDETVTLSFFDSQAVAFHKQLEAMRVDPKVMVVTSINPNIVGGRLFLNATSGTHVYFDKKTSAGGARFYKLIARDTGLPSAAPLLMSYAKVETMTIADLSSFIVTAESQEIDFLCTGKVVRVDTDKGWCYVACSKCSKKLQQTEFAFTCGVCNNSHAVGALRYRVEMAISDDTAEGTFVWFDGVLTKLHSIRASEAAQMLAEDGVNPEDTRLPLFIADMEGKTYTFQVRVTAFNFTEHHKTFTITPIAEDHGCLPVDGVGNNARKKTDAVS
ncbi:hypothetical protein F2Q69_00038001 [Brassica cretica]|uniref:Longin domain-containing protein n=1 Tax=Brassica cretica TaxID=69181 RepID=A0A8S9SQZ2_BRACR|nr:hypothetical protein F2Q69_00038001 [Brassica cretica]